MPLPSFLQPKDPQKPAERRPAPGAAAAGDESPVQAARTRARRRLIGAVVLLAAGIVGFPLLFETQPRPVAVDIAIETPRKDSGSVVPAPAPAPRASAVVVAEVPQPAVEAAPVAASRPPLPAPASAAAPKPVPASAAAPKPVPASAPASKPVGADDRQRAQALLDDRASSAAAVAKDGRFVVQVGAYTDPVALRDVRQKVEKLGLKTYTQVIDTDAGKRTRVRIGPYATRDEADAAGARLKAAGLPAAILTL